MFWQGMLSTYYRNGIFNSFIKYAAGFIAFIFGAWMGFKVFGGIISHNYLLIYFAILLMSYGATMVSRGLITIIAPDSNDSANSYAALKDVAIGIAFSVTYAPSIFIKFYEYDDWVYLAYKYSHLDFTYLNEAINLHYAPVLKLLMYFVSLLSDPTYYGNALLFFFFNIFLLSCLFEFLKRHFINERIAIVFTIMFALWPTFDMARFWWGGGFWLLIPLPLLLLTVLKIKNMLNSNKMGSAELIWVLFLSMLVVLSSSQVLLPIILIAAYISIYFLAKGLSVGTWLNYKWLLVLTMSFIPTIIGFYGRRYLFEKKSDFSGLYDGSFFFNIGAFIYRKVLFSNVVLIYLLAISIIFILLCSLIHTNKRRTELSIDKFATELSIIIFGLVGFIIYVIQVGVGRSWQAYAVITPYYVSYPLLLILLMIAGAYSIKSKLSYFFQDLNPNLSSGLRGRLLRSEHKFSYPAIILFLVYTGIHSFMIYRPKVSQINQVNAQKKFMADFGQASCDVIQNSSGDQPIALIPYKSFYPQCTKCGAYFKGPDSFLIFISKDDHFFRILAKSFAETYCAKESNRLLLDPTPSSLTTDGVMVSEVMKKFYNEYYH